MDKDSKKMQKAIEWFKTDLKEDIADSKLLVNYNLYFLESIFIFNSKIYDRQEGYLESY